MTPAQAAKILGFSETEFMDEEIVARAFHEKMRKHHPDAGGDGDTEAIKRLRTAKALVMKSLDQSKDMEDCPRCGGAGVRKTTRRSMIAPECKRCEGSGKVRKKT